MYAVAKCGVYNSSNYVESEDAVDNLQCTEDAEQNSLKGFISMMNLQYAVALEPHLHFSATVAHHCQHIQSASPPPLGPIRDRLTRVLQVQPYRGVFVLRSLDLRINYVYVSTVSAIVFGYPYGIC